MIYGDNYIKVLPLLGIQHLLGCIQARHFPIHEMIDFSYIRDESGKNSEKIPLKSFWMAQVYYSHPQIMNDELIIAAAKTEKWHKGVLFIRSFMEETNANLLQAIDLQNWHDTFQAALRSVNLVRNTDVEILGGYSSYSCGVVFSSGATFGAMNIEGPMYNKQVKLEDGLWESLKATVKEIVGLYNNDEMSTYMEHTPIWQ